MSATTTNPTRVALEELIALSAVAHGASPRGTIALDRWVEDTGLERAKPTIHRLVGLYPDTPLSRAAARYL